MATLKTDAARRGAKSHSHATPHANHPLLPIVREFEDLVLAYETGLLRSLQYDRHDMDDGWPDQGSRPRDDVRQRACQLAVADWHTTYTRKQLRQSLHAAESLGKSAEEHLHAAPSIQDGEAESEAESGLTNIHHGHFRLFSTELFDLLGQPTNLRFGTLRFHPSSVPQTEAFTLDLQGTAMEMALNSSYFVADSSETLPYHAFRIPAAPSLRNRGILVRKPEDAGAYPAYDSWLLFTFLGNGCLKVEVPVELCADVYGAPLRGRENEEVLFWGIFVEDDFVP